MKLFALTACLVVGFGAVALWGVRRAVDESLRVRRLYGDLIS